MQAVDFPFFGVTDGGWSKNTLGRGPFMTIRLETQFGGWVFAGHHPRQQVRGPFSEAGWGFSNPSGSEALAAQCVAQRPAAPVMKPEKTQALGLPVTT